MLPEGYIAAMDDGMISWRPSEGNRRNIRLQYPVTTLLAIGGPSGKCESVWCGDTQGNIVHISIPMLEILDKYCLNSSSIRAICAVSTTSEKVIVGASSGDIWTLGKEVPGNKTVKLRYCGMMGVWLKNLESKQNEKTDKVNGSLNKEDITYDKKGEEITHNKRKSKNNEKFTDTEENNNNEEAKKNEEDNKTEETEKKKIRCIKRILIICRES